jgi:hypothetical protein
MLAFSIASPAPKTMKDLTFLTRDGCVNTPEIAEHLDRVLQALHWPKDYQVIDIGTLPRDDPRTGYPTPTLLWKNKDIFGMAAPKSPFPEPT